MTGTCETPVIVLNISNSPLSKPPQLLSCVSVRHHRPLQPGCLTPCRWPQPGFKPSFCVGLARHSQPSPPTQMRTQRLCYPLPTALWCGTLSTFVSVPASQVSAPIDFSSSDISCLRVISAGRVHSMCNNDIHAHILCNLNIMSYYCAATRTPKYFGYSDGG